MVRRWVAAVVTDESLLAQIVGVALLNFDVLGAVGENNMIKAERSAESDDHQKPDARTEIPRLLGHCANCRAGAPPADLKNGKRCARATVSWSLVCVFRKRKLRGSRRSTSSRPAAQNFQQAARANARRTQW